MMAALCESLFSLLLLHVNMSFYFCGQWGCIFLHLFVKLQIELLLYCFKPRKNVRFKGRAEEVWAAVARLAWCFV